MKTFCSFASLAISAIASEDVGLWRWSNSGVADEVTILDKTANGHSFKWKMITKTGFEEDTGLSYFRIEHELEADIKASDEVTFEIAYIMEQDKWVNKTIMSEDGVICKVVQSTQDT